MKINRALNLVLPIEREGGEVYVHSTPVSEEVFASYWRVLAGAHARLFSEGLGVVSGPRVASLMLRAVAEERGVWEGDGGVQKGFMAEVRRISNVILPTGQGWSAIPLQNAIDRDLMTQEEVQEAEGMIVFFMLVSALNKRSQVPAMLRSAGGLWGFVTTSSNSTEFAASLPTLTATASSGEMMAASSVPH